MRAISASDAPSLMESMQMTAATPADDAERRQERAQLVQVDVLRPSRTVANAKPVYMGVVNPSIRYSVSPLSHCLLLGGPLLGYSFVRGEARRRRTTRATRNS